MRVYIVGIPYEVVRGYVRDRALGEIDHVRQTITIEEDLEYDQTVETILHEIVHGIEYAMSIELKNSDVFCISRGLYSVLTDPLNESLWAAVAGSDEIMEEEDDVDDLFEADEEMVETNPADYTRGYSGRISQYLRTTPKDDHQWFRGSGGDSD